MITSSSSSSFGESDEQETDKTYYIHGAVMACDMPEPCKFPSLDSCQKTFLWTHKEVDLDWIRSKINFLD